MLEAIYSVYTMFTMFTLGSSERKVQPDSAWLHKENDVDLVSLLFENMIFYKYIVNEMV